MTYEVIIQRRALFDLDEAYWWSAERAPLAAERWLRRFHERLNSLDRNPQRHAIALEGRRTKQEIRQLLFGKKPSVYRALYLVEPGRVRVLRVLRAQRRFLSRSDIDDALQPDDE
jgi:plasmid stabilization system protein ParE